MVLFLYWPVVSGKSAANKIDSLLDSSVRRIDLHILDIAMPVYTP
jgi:hypothetical protein